MRNLEIDLQEIDPSVMLPYWDWSVDSQDPLAASIFDPEYFGMTLGGDCNWEVTEPFDHCVVRNYNQDNFGTFHSSRTLRSIIRGRTDYDRFRVLIEGNPHGTVHVLIGGRGGDMSAMQSPNDPIFYLHHGFIDKLWADRQSSRRYRNQYDGRFNGSEVSLDDVMRPFGTTVGDVMRTTNLCYRYMPYSGRTSPSGLEILPEYENAEKELKVPAPLPEEWISMSNLSAEQVRSDAAALNSIMTGDELPVIDMQNQDNAGSLIKPSAWTIIAMLALIFVSL